MQHLRRARSSSSQSWGRWAAILAIVVGIAVGLSAGLAFGYSSNSTARRTFASPYVGGSDIFECGDVQDTIFVGDPGVPSLLPQGFVQAWGEYGVFCGAGAHNQLLKVQVQTLTSSGACTGPVAFGYQNVAQMSTYSAAQNCGRGRTYYSTAAAWLLIPFVGEYPSTATNGGYPEVTSAFWPN
jgi:hypothetical protein